MQESRRLGMNFITPEHITIALLSVGDVGARQVVHKCACCNASNRCGLTEECAALLQSIALPLIVASMVPDTKTALCPAGWARTRRQ